ncbi:MAG: hypothetical protein H6735_06535 [Alphaproteobacteria bacterium]|nr:hypothetical protein [Alphaproteobacteria bacterium]
MSEERAPGGVKVRRDGDTVRLTILPYLEEGGRNDLRVLRWLRWVVLVAGGGGLFVGDLVVRGLALLVILAAVAWMVWDAMRVARRQRSELTLAIGPTSAEVTVTTDGQVDRQDRVDLRAIGTASPVEAGYQRWHVLVNVAGREPLVVEMERHDETAAAWVAKRLVDAGRAARQ